MTDTETLTRPNWRGKAETKAVKQTLDIRDFKGRPGFALLLIAANPHLSVTDILECLRLHGVGRSRTWVTRRRWLFHDEAGQGAKADADGKDARALKIVAANPTLSLRDVSRLLSEAGIDRSREWVRRHRTFSDTESPIHKT
jgi:hypothetical protein